MIWNHIGYVLKDQRLRGNADGIRVVRHLHVRNILSKTYEQSEDDSDVDYSDKPDVDEALNTLIEGMLVTRGHLMRMKKAWHCMNCLIIFGNEDETSEPLSADLAKIMEKMFTRKRLKNDRPKKHKQCWYSRIQ